MGSDFPWHLWVELYGNAADQSVYRVRERTSKKRNWCGEKNSPHLNRL